MDIYPAEPATRMVHRAEFKERDEREGQLRQMWRMGRNGQNGREERDGHDGHTGANVIRMDDNRLVYLPPLSKEVNPLSWEQRAHIRESTNPSTNEYPRIFQAWNKADNLPDEDPVSNLARHDLCFMTPESLGLQADNSCPGLAAGFTPPSIAKALSLRKRLLTKNAHAIVLIAIPYRDALPGYFPVDSAFWQRDNRGEPIAGWADTLSPQACWKIDFTKTEVQNLITAKCLAAINSGVVDGIMLDWWNDGDADATQNQARLALLGKIRAAVGADALILINANNIRGDGDSPSSKLLNQSAPLVNGVFMESVQTLDSSGKNWIYTKEDWNNIEKALIWNEANLRAPRINCLELWFQQSRNDEVLMRAATTLSLTHSNGYALFSDPNHLPTPDHLHSWYPFWGKSLGSPVESPGRKQKDGSSIREFENGTVIYNSMLNKGAVTIAFCDQRVRASQADHQAQPAGTPFVIEVGDGDLFLKVK